MQSLCVFCGSSPGRLPQYVEAAHQLGKILAKNKITLVYGGASIGIMGAVADAVLENGGEAIGVIPKLLFTKEVAHERLTKLHIVESMHERKALMEKLSDGFIALPGGFGTFEELCEILTWSQLGIHRKPVGILNVGGYYDPLLELFNQAVREEFLKQEFRSLLIEASSCEELLEKFRTFTPPNITRWIQSSEKA